MSKLLVDELITTLSQSITFNNSDNILIKGLKLRLAFVDNPSGTFTVSFKRDSETLASKSFDMTDIKSELSTVNNNGHIYKGIEFDNPFPIDQGAYNVELSHSGYTFSESSFLAWIISHEDNFIKAENFNTVTAPKSLLIYTLNRRVNL